MLHQPAACSLGLGPAQPPRAGGLCSRSSSFVALKASARGGLLGLPPTARRRCAVRTAASAQPLLRGVARAAVRLLPANALATMFAAARSGRFAPLIVVGLVAYSVGVTIYATSGKRQVAAAAAAAATQQAAPPQPPTRSPSGSSLASLSALADDEVEGLASALAAAAVAPERPPAEKREKREDRGEVCKVCGGSGQVSYENHMQAYDGTVCPCCLGKGRVRHKSNNLISALLSFDP